MTKADGLIPATATRESLSPMQIVNALLASKSAAGARKQVKNLEAATRVALKNHEGNSVEASGDNPARRRLLEQ